MVVNLQFFGGRGASFANTSGTSARDSFRNANVKVFDYELSGMNMNLVEKTLKGVKDTLDEFGLPLSVVTSIGEMLSNKGEASVNGLGQLGFGRKAYTSKANEFPKSDRIIDSTAYGTGTHEAGHIISNYVMRKHNSGLSNLEQSKLRGSGKWDREILKKAKKLNGGKLSAISKYGSNFKGKAAAEVVAEGVSEYMKKGKSASPSSKAIVKALKSYL